VGGGGDRPLIKGHNGHTCGCYGNEQAGKLGDRLVITVLLARCSGRWAVPRFSESTLREYIFAVSKKGMKRRSEGN